MTYTFHDTYGQIPEELLDPSAPPELVRQAFVDMLATKVPSRGRWEFLVQEHTDDQGAGRELKETLLKRVREGSVRYAFGHVEDEGATYYASVRNPVGLRDLLRASPARETSGSKRRIEPLSPPLVGLNILMQSTRRFQEQVKQMKVEDPFNIYDADLDSMRIPDDINYGTVANEIDANNGLYLIVEKLPSFGVKVDPLGDLAMHALSLQSVQHLLDMYRDFGCIIIHKPPMDIGNVRVINPANMSELEANIKSHPWFGTIGPMDRTMTALTALE